MTQNDIDDEFTTDETRPAPKLKTKKKRKGNPTNDKPDGDRKPLGPILPHIDNALLIIDGFPVVPSGDRLIIEEVDNSTLTKDGLLIVDVGGKDNMMRVARIVAMSPDLLDVKRFPNMFYKVGDLVYFNHLNNAYMRLRVPGRNDLGRFFCLWITDVFGKFLAGDDYFSEAEKIKQELHLTGPLQRPEAEPIDASAVGGGYAEGESHGKKDDAISVPEGIDIT